MKQIIIKISSVVESGLGHWLFTHYCRFPGKTDYSYEVRASLEGFRKITDIWKEAGYEVIFKNEYPR